jgi:hypothetical protein
MREPYQLDLALEKRRRESNRDRTLRLLSDHLWHPGRALEEVGGRRFGARVFELRREEGRCIVTRLGRFPAGNLTGDSEWRLICDCTGGLDCAECKPLREGADHAA